MAPWDESLSRRSKFWSHVPLRNSNARTGVSRIVWFCFSPPPPPPPPFSLQTIVSAPPRRLKIVSGADGNRLALRKVEKHKAPDSAVDKALQTAISELNIAKLTATVRNAPWTVVCSSIAPWDESLPGVRNSGVTCHPSKQ
ncbi:hypothetical protein CEXT_119391 [Caerostris extrusa]|uniref:Uncharacterized protein n=1 Tax=Caerostris extrusa TaxID=172846 RepID=A0AAV4UIZ1_CAEEX|nr:hypothetical protein CEXT_119391 [Caerostris extrusa]